MTQHLARRAFAIVLLTGALAATPQPAQAGTGSAGSSASSPQAAAERRAPLRPPARICGAKRLKGPAARPRGAVRVRTTDRLDRVVANRPPGTTFWLKRGVHRLGTHQYDQVRPKRGMTFVGAPGAVLDGRRVNRYAFSGHATGVRIEHLTIRNFGRRGSNNNEGVVNHDGAHDWTIQENTVHHNAGAGVFVASGNVVAHNCLRDNGQYGFSAYEADGVTDVVLRHNEIKRNNRDNWEARIESCGCSGGGKFWDTRDARIVRNWIHRNFGVGLWADTNNTEFLVRGNHISDNSSEGFIYETSYNAAIVENTFARNALADGPRNPGFPTAALYLSESGSDPRAGARYGRTFEVARNRFVNNWAGVMAWENADRFAGSPANTSTGYTTLVNPGVATLAACSDPRRIRRAPYFDDCRWKTQRLRVHHNLFRFDPSVVGRACRPRSARSQCGMSGLASQWGTWPKWSPYRGAVVEKNITFRQDNLWHSNRYVGPWRFHVKELHHIVRPGRWQRAPYRQDRNSTWRGRSPRAVEAAVLLLPSESFGAVVALF